MPESNRIESKFASSYMAGRKLRTHGSVSFRRWYGPRGGKSRDTKPRKHDPVQWNSRCSLLVCFVSSWFQIGNQHMIQKTHMRHFPGSKNKKAGAMIQVEGVGRRCRSRDWVGSHRPFCFSYGVDGCGGWTGSHQACVFVVGTWGLEI